MILLNPGPVNLSPRVRRALAGPDLCHRESEYFDLQDAVRAGLLGVYGLDPATWTAVLLGGSGTAAVEAVLVTLVPRDGRLLVVGNGVYGDRMSRIAGVHDIAAAAVDHEWGAAIDPRRVQRALDDDPGISHVAVVHHETTTGRLNDLEELVELCRGHGARLLIDSVSSYGAEAIPLAGDGIDACAGTANKCLHGAPGVAFAVVRRAALERACDPPRSVYLDLAAWGAEQDRRGTPFTPSVPALHALREALDEHREHGGRPARHARYRALAERVREGLAALGVEPYLDPGASSVVLRSYRLPPGTTSDRLHDGLKEHGFVIYAGQRRLKEELFRISTMGEIDDGDVERLLAAFRAVLGAPAARGSERS